MNRMLCIIVLASLLGACGRHPESGSPDHDHGSSAAEPDFERGPHRGRLLRDGDFSLEVAIHETGVPPQFRLYAYREDKPIAPAEVSASIVLRRLDGEENRFAFRAENDYLRGDATVHEPHSFDVEVLAGSAGTNHRWQYASYEGRTTIASGVAAEAGVEVATAGAAVIRDTLELVGEVGLDANRHALVKARFPGIVRAVPVEQGQRVRRGQVLAQVEGNESMRSYPVTAPIDGVLLARHTNVGDVAGEDPLFELADLSRVWVQLRAIGTDADRLAPGQAVRIRSATSDTQAEGRIETLLPLAGSGQSVIARLAVPNGDGRWRPGMMVAATVTVASREVPLAVRESGLQRFRDFTVVFAQVGDTYEVRMLELGARDGEHAEVLGGLKAGTSYVSGQSYLIKADIEKAGASHDH